MKCEFKCGKKSIADCFAFISSSRFFSFIAVITHAAFVMKYEHFFQVLLSTTHFIVKLEMCKWKLLVNRNIRWIPLLFASPPLTKKTAKNLTFKLPLQYLQQNKNGFSIFSANNNKDKKYTSFYIAIKIWMVFAQQYNFNPNLPRVEYMYGLKHWKPNRCKYHNGVIS